MEELDTSGSFNAQVCQICNALFMKGDEGKEDGERSSSELRMPLFVVYFDCIATSVTIVHNNQSINRGTDGRKIVRPWSNAWTMVTGGWIMELVYLWVVR